MELAQGDKESIGPEVPRNRFTVIWKLHCINKRSRFGMGRVILTFLVDRIIKLRSSKMPPPQRPVTMTAYLSHGHAKLQSAYALYGWL